MQTYGRAVTNASTDVTWAASQHLTEYCDRKAPVFHLNGKSTRFACNDVIREFLLKDLRDGLRAVEVTPLKSLTNEIGNGGFTDNLLKPHCLSLSIKIR